MLRKTSLTIAILSLGLVAAVPAQAGDRAVGAVVGAGAGAIIGNAMGGRDGALLGGVIGAVAGSALAHASRDRYPVHGVVGPAYGAPAPVYGPPVHGLPSPGHGAYPPAVVVPPPVYGQPYPPPTPAYRQPVPGGAYGAVPYPPVGVHPGDPGYARWQRAEWERARWEQAERERLDWERHVADLPPLERERIARERWLRWQQSQPTPYPVVPAPHPGAWPSSPQWR